MAVRRIVPDISTTAPDKAAGFYGNVLGMTKVMEAGFIQTWAAHAASPVQISFAREGGSGTATPDLSIEVDNLDEVLQAVRHAGFEITYGPVTEPWGVRRFFVRDPFGRIVNVLEHGD